MAGEPPAPGMIALVTPDGRTRPVADDIHFGNGMAVTPDNATLIVAEGGEVLQTVDVDRGCFACMLGGPDGRTLFVVARE
jgi:sugar lactone lactonase YvrE